MAIHSKNKDIRTVALRLLSFRDHTERELSDKLRQRGFALAEIEPLCAEFAQKGYLSNRRVAETFIEGALRRQDKGTMRLKQELKKRHVDSELVDEVIESYRQQVDEEQAAKQIVERLLVRGRETKYIERYLWRQGFSPSTVRSALNLDNELVDS